MKGSVLLDVGGTEIKSAAYSGSGKRLDAVHSASSYAQADRDTILGNLLAVTVREKAVLEAGGFRLGAVGLAFPGPFDYEKGICRIRGLAKYDAIEGLPLEDALKSLPGQTVLTPEVRFFFRHDLESFARGLASLEPVCAEGRVLCLCIGTGAGSAFLEGGRLLKQAPGVPPDGWIYPFPFRGLTIDDWISARGLERLAREAGFPPGTSGKELSALAAWGDPRAAGVWRTFGLFIAEALQPFIDAFRPDRLVLGGQISKAERYFGKELKDRHTELPVLTVSDTTEYTLEGLLVADREG